MVSRDVYGRHMPGVGGVSMNDDWVFRQADDLR